MLDDLRVRGDRQQLYWHRFRPVDFAGRPDRPADSSPARNSPGKIRPEWPNTQTPDWVRDAVFYQIFPDRFASSLTVPKPRHLDEWGSPPTYHGYQGGDLIGVVEHLDYLVDLGINGPLLHARSSSRRRITAITRTTTRRSTRCSAATPRFGGCSTRRTAAASASCSTASSTTPAAASSRSTTSWRTARIRPTSTGSRSTSSRSTPTTPEAAELSSLVGPAGPAEVQHRLAGGPRVPLGRRPQVDRVRHRRLAAGRAQRDRRRCLLA